MGVERALISNYKTVYREIQGASVLCPELFNGLVHLISFVYGVLFAFSILPGVLLVAPSYTFNNAVLNLHVSVLQLRPRILNHGVSLVLYRLSGRITPPSFGKSAIQSKLGQ